MPAKIQKRGEGKYRLTVYQGRDAQGKQIIRTKTVSATSDRDANKQYALFVAEVEKGLYATSGKMTLREYYDYYTENYAKPRHADKTIVYNNSLFARIDQALGHKRLDKIEAKHLLQFFKNLAEPGISKRRHHEYLSPNTIQKHYTLLHTMFQKAVQWQLIAYNPASKIDKPKKIKVVKRIYDEKQFKAFLDHLESESLKHRVMVFLILSTGMRKGEMFGLQWKHIDLVNNTVNIEQSCQYLSQKGSFIKGTKTGEEHIVSIPASVALLLTEYYESKMEERNKLEDKWEGAQNIRDDFVFTTWNGKLAHPGGFNTWLKRYVVKYDLPPITPHSFRHMAATYLITAGVDLRTVAGKLGHASTATTQLVYSHLMKKAERETADIMEGIINNLSTK